MLSDFLMYGRLRAKKIKALSREMGKAPRDIQKLAEWERKKGAPICASTDGDKGGLYLAANKEEMLNYINTLTHRIKQLCILRACCKKTAEAMEE